MVTLPSCCGYNIGWLLRQIVKKGVSFLESLFLRLRQGVGLARKWPSTPRSRLMRMHGGLAPAVALSWK